jgi:hypothetical protein
MRKLDLTDYQVTGRVKGSDGNLVDIAAPYHVKDSILNLMFIRELQLSGAELVKQNVLAMKLENCKDDEVLLEDEEYNRIKKAIDTFRGFNRNDVELVRRINEAEVVEVETKK